MRHFRFAPLAASLNLAHSAACWSFHLSQPLNKWVSTTIVLRVAPPAVVVRSVIRAHP